MCRLDAIFRVVADRRRRLALCCLQEHHRVALADMAEFVAERETGNSVPAISSERVRDVYVSLYHEHVPLLEEENLADYEQENDVIARTDQTTAVLTDARDALNSML